MWKEKSAEFLRKNMKNSVLVEISINLKYDNGYSLYNSHPVIYGAVIQNGWLQISLQDCERERDT